MKRLERRINRIHTDICQATGWSMQIEIGPVYVFGIRYWVIYVEPMLRGTGDRVILTGGNRTLRAAIENAEREVANGWAWHHMTELLDQEHRPRGRF